jgi:hypothetical protein
LGAIALADALDQGLPFGKLLGRGRRRLDRHGYRLAHANSLSAIQSSDASGNLCPVDDFAEPAVMGVAVPPGDVAADHDRLLGVTCVVSAVEGEVAQRLELCLDPVQPRRIVGV